MTDRLALPLPDRLTRRCRSGNRPGAEGHEARGAMVRPRPLGNSVRPLWWFPLIRPVDASGPIPLLSWTCQALQSVSRLWQ